MTTVPNLNPIPEVTGDDLLISHDITTNRSGRIAASVLKDYINTNIPSDEVVYGVSSLSDALKRGATIVDTYSTLSSLDGNLGDVVYLTGYTVADIGGGYWRCVSATGLTAYNGLCIIIGAKAWVRVLLDRRITPEMFGAMGDGVVDDTTALSSAIRSKLPLWLTPGRVYLTGRIGSVNGQNLHITSSPVNKGAILLKTSTYTGDSTEWLSWSEANYSVHLENIILDQNWTNITYPAGFSQNDSQLASTWGGNGWLMKIASNQQANAKILSCEINNCFRGIQASSFNRLEFIGNSSVSMSGLSHCIIATELTTSVVYSRNYLKTRDWFNYPGYTGDDGLHGNKCRNVLISDNHLIGHQLVFHAYPQGGSADGMGERIKVINNILEYPPADTAFYRWKDCNVSNNSIHHSGDMGIAVSASSYTVVSGNVIKGVHVGGIGITDCTQVVVTGNIITDWAQGYDAIETLGGRYTSGAGLWKAGIVCDYQSGGQKGVNCTITGNTLVFDNLPPVADGGPFNSGIVRAETYGIYVDITSNPASQSTMCITGNFIKSDAANLPKCRIFAPTHRCYITSVTGTPIQFERFKGSAGSFRYIADFGAGSLLFMDKVVGTPTASVTYTGETSSAVITINAVPQFTITECVVESNYSADYVDPKLDRQSSFLFATATVDPANILNGAILGFAITTPGAAVGDFCLVAPPYELQGLTMTSYVSNTSEVTVVLKNDTGAAKDLASGLWKVKVIKAYE